MFRVFIDWDNDGNFSGPYDEVTQYVMSASWDIGIGTIWGRVCDDSFCTIVLKNTDGRFNPENTSSPLYGKIRPQRPLKIEIDNTVVFYGFINTPISQMVPAGVYTGKTEVTIDAFGYRKFLDAVVNLPTLANITTDQVIDQVLSQIALPTGETLSDKAALETGKYEISIYDAVSNTTAIEIINDIVNTEQGYFYFDRDGSVVFLNRHHVIIDDTIVQSITTASLIDYNYGFGRNLLNRIRITTASRTPSGSPEVLWSLDEPIEILKDQRIEFYVRLRRPNGQFVSAASLTPTYNFSQGSALITIESFGGKAKILIQNTFNAKTILSELTISGIPEVKQNIFEVVVSNQDSVDEFGLQEKQLFIGSTITPQNSLSIAQYLLSIFSNLTGDVSSFTVKTRLPDNYLDIKIGSKISVNISNANGHSGTYLVIGESHEYSVGKILESTYRLAPTSNAIYWRLGITGYSELGQTTRLIF